MFLGPELTHATLPTELRLARKGETVLGIHTSRRNIFRSSGKNVWQAI